MPACADSDILLEPGVVGVCKVRGREQQGQVGNYVVGANVAGPPKVADVLLDESIV